MDGTTNTLTVLIFVLSAAICWGCGSQPEAPPMTDDLQPEIDSQDAKVDQMESQQG